MDEKQQASVDLSSVKELAQELQRAGIPRQQARASAREALEGKRRTEIVHRRKLFGGKYTAEDLHRELAFPKGAKCTGCPNHPAISIKVFCPLDELVKRDGVRFGAALASMPDEVIAGMMTRLFDEPHVRVSDVYACSHCAPAAERAAAKLPSFLVVHINRGPGADNFVSGWTGGE